MDFGFTSEQEAFRSEILQWIKEEIPPDVEGGWEIENVDSVVIAEEPRVAPHIVAMRRALARAMETDVERVSVKGKTTEGMGFEGRGEGISAHAVVLLIAVSAPT